MASKARVVICILRNDLRYHDNEVLSWAYKNAEFVLPLYCFDPRHFKFTWHYGYPKTGPFRAKFIWESVVDLREQLKARCSLFVRHGKPEKILPDLISRINTETTEVQAIALQSEPTKEELDVENAIKSECGVPVRSIWGSTLYHIDDLPFKVQSVPDVYTDFRKKVENGSRVRNSIQMPESFKPPPPNIKEGKVPNLRELGENLERKEEPKSAFPFQGGETTGLQRLHHYLWDTDFVAKYKETRNGMLGHEYSTKFSTWLSIGCLSPRRIYEEIKRYEKERTSNQSTYWVIFELLWRDYFRFVACRYGERIFDASGLTSKDVEWNKDDNLAQAWKEGKTGVPFVDANMRELAQTGFMSNRGRQNVASFLTKDLKLDWRIGAEWFEYLLLDHDVCSNYGNWLYSAGIGNDPRQDRKFNMIKQGLDYDPEGDYIRQWIPELSSISGGEIHTPWRLSSTALTKASVTLGETYPKPVVVAPEWEKHASSKASKATGPSRQQGGPKRGMDFYFSSSSKQ